MDNKSSIENPLIQELHKKIISALAASPESYDLDAVVCSHRAVTSGPSYWALEILKRPCFRFRGVKKKVVEIAPFLNTFMEQSGLQFDITKGSGDWKRALQTDFEQWLAAASDGNLVALYDKVLESNGFDCCSHYQECSDIGHCVHPDIMFAGQCGYRKKLKSGIIFFGKNRNI